MVVGAEDNVFGQFVQIVLAQNGLGTQCSQLIILLTQRLSGLFIVYGHRDACFTQQGYERHIAHACADDRDLLVSNAF